MATKRTDFSQGYTPQGMPIVLITEPTYLPTDYLSVDHDRIFTEQFDPSFQ